MNEKHILHDDSYSDKVDIELNLKHLTKLLQSVFQKLMFQLIAYSILSKLKLLKTSRLQVRGEHTASALANDLNPNDLKRPFVPELNNDMMEAC